MWIVTSAKSIGSARGAFHQDTGARLLAVNHQKLSVPVMTPRVVPMGSPKGDAPVSEFIDELAFMASAPAVDLDALQWWTNALGGAQMRYYQTTATFCEGPHPVYPDMTLDNINADGIVGMFHLWMAEYIYSVRCYD